MQIKKSNFMFSRRGKIILTIVSIVFGRGVFMEKRLNLLFGIIGGLCLVLLRALLNLSMALGSMRGYVTDILFGILSIIGIISIIYFSILLIIDAVRTVHKG